MSEILLIEDDEDIRLTTIEFLEMEGFHAIGCENGKAAIQYLLDQNTLLPKLILADLNMPVMDGLTFRARQLDHPDWKSIPCVIMSADGRIDAKCLQVGIQTSLKKPVDLDELLSLILNYVPSSKEP